MCRCVKHKPCVEGDGSGGVAKEILILGLESETDDLVKHEVEFVAGRLPSRLCRGPKLGHLDVLTVLPA